MMKTIGEGEQLIKSLSGHNSLLDTKVKRISIFEEEDLLIGELEFAMRPLSKYRNVVLKFTDVKEYSFYYNDNHVFYNVERFKFFRMENGSYYLSLDPYEEEQVPSDQDQDIVVAKNVVGYEN